MASNNSWRSPVTALAAKQPMGRSMSFSSKRLCIDGDGARSRVGSNHERQGERWGSWDGLAASLAVSEWLLDKVLPIMHPDSPARKAWDFWTLALIMCVAIATPLQIAFSSWRDSTATQAVAWATSGSFFLDILVNFRTSYTTKHGDVIRSPALIAHRYLKGMFLFDLLSALPLNETLTQTSIHYNAAWLGLLKMPRLFRLVRHLDTLTRTKYVNLVAVARLLLLMLLITHWAACLWHYLSREVPEWPWMFQMDCSTCPEREQYLLAFYRCFLLILGDRPDTWNNVERVFAVCLLFLGACLYAVVVSSITMLVSNMWSMAARHKQHASMLQDALRYHSASTELSVKVDEFFDFMARYDHPGLEGVSLLAELPAGLHAEVLSSVFEPMLLKVPLFAYCERPFVWRLAQRLRLQLFMGCDVIYDLDSVGHNMYIIWKGVVALVGPDGCTSALLTDGDHFGERGVTTASTPRPHKAVALRACDLMLLSRWDLQDAMRDFPDSAVLVKDRARLQNPEYSATMWAATIIAGLKDPEEELPSSLARAGLKQTNPEVDSDIDLASDSADVVTAADLGDSPASSTVGSASVAEVEDGCNKDACAAQDDVGKEERRVGCVELSGSAGGFGALVVVDASADTNTADSSRNASASGDDEDDEDDGGAPATSSSRVRSMTNNNSIKKSIQCDPNMHGNATAVTALRPMTSLEQQRGSAACTSSSRWMVDFWLQDRSSPGLAESSAAPHAAAAGASGAAGSGAAGGAEVGAGPVGEALERSGGGAIMEPSAAAASTPACGGGGALVGNAATQQQLSGATPPPCVVPSCALLPHIWHSSSALSLSSSSQSTARAASGSTFVRPPATEGSQPQILKLAPPTTSLARQQPPAAASPAVPPASVTAGPKARSLSAAVLEEEEVVHVACTITRHPNHSEPSLLSALESLSSPSPQHSSYQHQQQQQQLLQQQSSRRSLQQQQQQQQQHGLAAKLSHHEAATHGGQSVHITGAPHAGGSGSQALATVGSGIGTRRSLAGLLQFRWSRAGNGNANGHNGDSNSTGNHNGVGTAASGGVASASMSPLLAFSAAISPPRRSTSYDQPRQLRGSESCDRRRSGEVWDQVTQWVEQATLLQDHGAMAEEPTRWGGGGGVAGSSMRSQREGSASQARPRRRSNDALVTGVGVTALAAAAAGQLEQCHSGGATTAASSSIPGAGGLSRRSSDGTEILEEFQRGRDLSGPPQFLLLPPQPFLGLDPLGPFFEGSSGPPTMAAASPMQRSRSRPGHGSQSTAVAYTGRVSPRSTVEGDGPLPPAPRHVFGSACRRSSGRQEAPEVSGSGIVTGTTAARPARNSGMGMRNMLLSECSERSADGLRGEDRDARCLLLERQLALVQAQLEDAQSQVATLLANPLKVPAVAAVVRREVDAATAQLNTHMEGMLQRFMDALQAVAARTDELTQQVAAADGRLERLEEEHDAFLQSGGQAGVGVGVGLSTGTGVLDSRDIEELAVAPSLGLLRSRGVTTGQLSMLRPTSTTSSGGAAGRAAGGDAGRAQVNYARQQSYTRMQHQVSRRPSAFGGAPELDPFNEISAAAIVTAPEGDMNPMLQRAKSGARRRSALGQQVNGAAAQGSLAGALGVQLSSSPSSVSRPLAPQTQPQGIRHLSSYPSGEFDARTSPVAGSDEGRPAQRPGPSLTAIAPALNTDSLSRVSTPVLDTSVRRGELGLRHGDAGARWGEGSARRVETSGDSFNRRGDSSVRKGEAFLEVSPRWGDVSVRRGNRRAAQAASAVMATRTAAAAAAAGAVAGSNSGGPSSTVVDEQQPNQRQSSGPLSPKQAGWTQLEVITAKKTASERFQEITAEEDSQPLPPVQRGDERGEEGSGAAMGLRRPGSGAAVLGRTSSSSTVSGGMGRNGGGGGGGGGGASEWGTAVRRNRFRRGATSQQQEQNEQLPRTGEPQQHAGQGAMAPPEV